ncbi:DUF1186 domain-containing protein [Mesorhizobium sp. BAC0120]|uniref:DUF1186 domain-containing protein n=1 Tax=Mesorhizobium sp. BAC0120 TaxID=3090670 RepID=UPI00298C0311|nr:DUF1186 domain-containing protein [Mesorhizobium sp. BAC0120]MDW6022397.1 DUF1186 domain-containing protein [Mesorhizobium sp. BAC0120]
MTFEEIIHSFATSDTVPVEAIRAALEARTAFVEKAVLLLDRVALSESSEEEDESVAILVHVLGEIGDERAFLPLMRVLALPTDHVEMLLGADTITETLGNVLISTMGDHVSVLEEALANTEIDDFVRNAIFEAWTWLALTGKMSNDRAKAFLSDYPVRVGLNVDDFGWASWVDSVTVLGFAEMTDFAREHLWSEGSERSMFDFPDISFEGFEHQLAQALADPDGWKTEAKYQPFTDTIGDLSGWYCFSEKYRNERAGIDERAELGSFLYGDDSSEEEDPIFNTPYIASNPYRDVGRNDPCPCGSGKKFKKCCLSEVQ